MEYQYYLINFGIPMLMELSILSIVIPIAIPLKYGPNTSTIIQLILSGFLAISGHISLTYLDSGSGEPVARVRKATA